VLIEGDVEALNGDGTKPLLWTGPWTAWTWSRLNNGLDIWTWISTMPNYSAAKFWHYLMSWAHHIYATEITIWCQSPIFEAITLHSPCAFSKPQFTSIKTVKVRQRRVWQHQRWLIGCEYWSGMQEVHIINIGNGHICAFWHWPWA